MLFICFLFIFFYTRKKTGKNDIVGRNQKEEEKYLGERVIIRGIGLTIMEAVTEMSEDRLETQECQDYGSI